jgi:hypothetical protein
MEDELGSMPKQASGGVVAEPEPEMVGANMGARVQASFSTGITKSQATVARIAAASAARAAKAKDSSVAKAKEMKDTAQSAELRGNALTDAKVRVSTAANHAQQQVVRGRCVQCFDVLAHV